MPLPPDVVLLIDRQTLQGSKSGCYFLDFSSGLYLTVLSLLRDLQPNVFRNLEMLQNTALHLSIV